MKPRVAAAEMKFLPLKPPLISYLDFIDKTNIILYDKCNKLIQKYILVITEISVIIPKDLQDYVAYS